MQYQLDTIREEIDRLDDEIVDLLGQRFALLRDVAAYKRPRDIPVVIPERINEVVERCAARGLQRGLDAQMVRAIAKQAEAERLRRARIISAEAEQQAATKLVEAGEMLAGQPQAMQLRYLNALTDVAGERSSTIVLPLPLDLLRRPGD